MTIDGRFIWHELRVPELDDGARFYAELFGWTSEAAGMGLVFHAGDAVVGGASPVKPGLPSHWTPYVGSSDVDAVARRAGANGGIVTTGQPADVPGQGRIAPILDPHMSIFAVLTPTAEVATGGFIWDRLRTPDVEVSASFYEQVLGWTARVDSTGGVFELDGTRVGEVVAGEGGWLPFVLVGSLEDARARAVKLGASVLVEEEKTPDSGRFAVIADPQGATIAIHQR